MRIWCYIKITPLKLIFFILNTCLNGISLKLCGEFTYRSHLKSKGEDDDTQKKYGVSDCVPGLIPRLMPHTWKISYAHTDIIIESYLLFSTLLFCLLCLPWRRFAVICLFFFSRWRLQQCRLFSSFLFVCQL